MGAQDLRDSTQQPAPLLRHDATSVSLPPLDGPRSGESGGSAISAAFEASLHLAASLLAQCTEPESEGEPVLDIEVGGYRWTATRCDLIPPAIDPSLSPREREIVRMVALGLTNRAIASALEISPWTVSTYLRRVFGKLDVNSRAAMVAQAIKLGLHSGTGG